MQKNVGVISKHESRTKTGGTGVVANRMLNALTIDGRGDRHR